MKSKLFTVVEDINIQYMRCMTGILLFAVCLYFCAGYLHNPAIFTPVSAIIQNELPIYSVETEEPVLALTFDAAWGDEDLDDILAILDAHHAKATFFVSGDWVEKYPDAIHSIYQHRHELANHGTNHKHMPALSDTEILDEIMTCHQRVLDLTGYSMTAFRAPYSDWDDRVVAAAHSCNYSCINQNVDSVDWKEYGTDHFIETVLSDPDLDNGAIILLHNGTRYTRDALDRLLTGLETQGYRFVTISDLVYPDHYTLDHTGRQFPD